MSYDEVYSRSLSDPEGFWGEAAQAIHWEKPWDRVLDDSNPPFYRWFTGGELNTCYNALDRHVEAGRGDQAALIYDSPVTDTKRTYHLLGADRRGRPLRRRPRGARRDQGRPGHRLHAHGARGGHRHAGLRPHRRDSLGGLRRLRRQGAGHPHRRCQAQGHRRRPPAASSRTGS